MAGKGYSQKRSFNSSGRSLNVGGLISQTIIVTGVESGAGVEAAPLHGTSYRVRDNGPCVERIGAKVVSVPHRPVGDGPRAARPFGACSQRAHCVPRRPILWKVRTGVIRVMSMWRNVIYILVARVRLDDCTDTFYFRNSQDSQLEDKISGCAGERGAGGRASGLWARGCGGASAAKRRPVYAAELATPCLPRSAPLPLRAHSCPPAPLPRVPQPREPPARSYRQRRI
ncbi:unnamed protein product [Danaus chrysippus]|uniref:(African queen) hypothetical protein n=1 Tax=Danaus chrysippus TaxID=151541 RepID=A0A8J2W995_9NEOP|nr:unnamed protein product [Danaus chrysippus]